MLTCSVQANPIFEQKTDAYALLIDDLCDMATPVFRELAARYFPPLEAALTQRSFAGAAGDCVLITGIDGSRPVAIIIAGLGSMTRPHYDRLEQLRRAIGKIARAAEGAKVTSIAVAFPDEHWFAVDPYTVAKEIALSFDIAVYHFDQYITDPARRYTRDYNLLLCAPELLHKQITLGIDHGLRIAYAVNQARHWCDLPPCVLTPAHMAEQAERIARSHNLTYSIWGKKQINDAGMGGLIAVSQGSAQDPRLVIMEYTSQKKGAPRIALVGKGVTFDSGGLSIKPAARMDEMKDDMAGAAAVISTMELIAHLQPEVHVVGLAPITENLPSGTACKPGDIIQFYNGKTAEIKNTDAEGRLILADALSYAVKHYELDAIINIATLTGSCSAALGPFFCGLMSQHQELADRVLRASRRSGDRAWPLPFHDDYKVAIRSTVADLCNIGNDSYRAGSITAGFFLQAFVGGAVPWVHLDVAGTSFNVPDISYYRPGATGFGVRLFADMLLNWHAAY